MTDAGLEHISGLSQLESLFLDGTQVAGAGLEYLKNLTELKTLSLNACADERTAGCAKSQEYGPNSKN